jgi:hypothetical protein
VVFRYGESEGMMLAVTSAILDGFLRNAPAVLGFRIPFYSLHGDCVEGIELCPSAPRRIRAVHLSFRQCCQCAGIDPLSAPLSKADWACQTADALHCHSRTDSRTAASHANARLTPAAAPR